MVYCSTDIFGCVEGNSDNSVKEEEEPEEEQAKDGVSSIFEEKGDVKYDKPDYDLWHLLCQQVGMISKNSM